MARQPKKSRVSGLFKECDHLWDSCSCQWLGRFRGERRVNLGAWAGERNVTKTRARELLAQVQAQVLQGRFRKEGRDAKPLVGPGMPFTGFLDLYLREEVQKRGLVGKSLPAFVKAIRTGLGQYTLEQLATTPMLVESWMESMREREVPLSHTTTKTRRVVWGPTTWNAYLKMGTRLFNWARHPKRKLCTENPFSYIERAKGEVNRETRISDEQQRALVAVCEQWMDTTRKGSGKPNARLRRRGREMYRRLCGAFDTGLRAGELSAVQVKHIDYTNWRIRIPWSNAKGGKTTGRDEYVWVASERLQRVLEQRRFLGAEAYVFGTEEGAQVKKFHNAWRALYSAAGIPANLRWHDARHEFVSSLIEEGGTIQEVKEAARHKNIATTARYMKAEDERLKALLARKSKRSVGSIDRI